jgi:hypothetical protein
MKQPMWTTNHVYGDDGNSLVKYRLKPFFDQRAVSSGALAGDCQDVSNHLRITWLALVISGTCTQLYSDQWPDPGWRFETNAVCPTPCDATVYSNYRSYLFAFHQLVTMGGNVYDAACAQWKVLPLAGGRSYFGTRYHGCWTKRPS